MALDENGIEIINEPSESEKRIKQLAEKVRLTSEERDEERRLNLEKDAKLAELEKENTFNSGFSDILGIHSAAKDHKDDIKTKVMSGMSVEDATFAVLGKAGKLEQPKIENHQNVAGGSATTTISQGGNKTVSEMSRDEKRAALVELEKQGVIGLA